MITYLIAIPLIAHGLANLAGVFAPWTKSRQGFIDASWAFSQGVTLISPIGRAFSLVWLLSSIGLIAGGLGLIFQLAWGVPLAIAGCILSLIAILPWWKAVPPGARIAVILDLVLIVVLLSPLSDQLIPDTAAALLDAIG